MVTVQTDLGLRGEELLQLKREHVDLDEGIVSLPTEIQKGGRV